MTKKIIHFLDLTTFNTVEGNLMKIAKTCSFSFPSVGSCQLLKVFQMKRSLALFVPIMLPTISFKIVESTISSKLVHQWLFCLPRCIHCIPLKPTIIILASKPKSGHAERRCLLQKGTFTPKRIISALCRQLSCVAFLYSSSNQPASQDIQGRGG